ncbi:MAG: nuclease [Bacillota bacterium]|jgi:DNA-binding NarL/FixJ family response regulator|nr:nuclease [Bacillota bacterium]
MKGIYSIEINQKLYIGKDAQIDKSKRLKDHLLMLKKNCHYNRYLQKSFNKYKKYKYRVLYKSNEISLEQLSKLEKHYIKKLGSYKQGYNLTLGGEGGLGIVVDEKGRQIRSERIIGELNPQSKLSNEQFYEIVELFKAGKTNSEVAEIYSLHDRYVSLIRHKKRFQKLWATVEDYEEEKSNGQKRALTYEQFIKVVEMLKKGATNAGIERAFNLSAGTGSRIRHKRLYRRFWNKYIEDNQ